MSENKRKIGEEIIAKSPDDLIKKMTGRSNCTIYCEGKWHPYYETFLDAEKRNIKILRR